MKQLNIATILTVLSFPSACFSPAQTVYPDGRPSAALRMEAKDQGVVLRHGDGPGQCDFLGAREALIFEEKGVYHLFYDGAGPKGWLACLATSKDLQTWEKKGPILDFGKPGENDCAAACSPWVCFDGKEWHMFYLGTPNASAAPDLVPSFPYLTMKARSKSLAGPWRKQPELVPFLTKPGTYYAETASPGHIVKQGNDYLMFFSASMPRTLGIARTKDLNGPWTIDPKPIVPAEEQIENSSLYFEASNKTWFLFTNHIGLDVDHGEYTDAVWVYWSKDLNRWDAKNKAVVLDGKNCTWSKKCIGMPSVVRVGKRLAIFYDAPGGSSTSHMKRDIGLAWLDLPLSPPKPNQQSADPNEWRFALTLDAASPAKQPYPVLNGGAFDGPVVRESPDPLIGYRWKETKADDDLQVYTLRPVAAVADAKDAFGNLESATGAKTAITVKGTGSIRLDFGVESAAWLEFDSPDLAGHVEMSISEYNQPAVVNNGPEHPVKTAIPVKHGNTYRLELNSELYEGVRFGWIHVRSFTSQWHITGVRLVCQAKPTNYNGSFSCNDTMLTKIWYAGAYGVKLNLTKDYFGAILMDRGDRISWTGDAHPSQAASLVAFGNYDFIKKNIGNTSGQDNGIRSYSLYWVLSLVDYYRYTGDTATLQTYIPNAIAKLDNAYRVYGTNPELRFYGWDERLGAGFEQPSCMESQNAYKMLSIRAWKEFASAMGALGRTDLRDKYHDYANEKIALLRHNSLWYKSFGLHATADAVTTGLLNAEEKKAVFEQSFTDRVNRVSFSPFNQYFVLQAFALMNKYDDALSSVRDLWGGMIQYGGTTFFEDFRPSWNKALGKNDPVPNNQAGYTSLCHPWGGGVTKWLSEEVLGIKPTSPGFSTFDITPHPGRTLTSVSGTTPTPHGNISARFDVLTGACAVSVPAGTVGRIGIPKVEKTINAIKVNGTLAWDGAFHAVAGIGGATPDPQFVYLTGVQSGSYSIAVSYSGVTPAYSEPQESYPARFIGEDSTTSGNWGKVYGKEGFVLCNYNGNRSDKIMLPTYVSSFIFHKANEMNNASPLVWSSGTTDTRALAPDSGNTIPRNAACMFTDWATMSFTFTIEGTREYSIALYFLDWDDKGRRIAVEMMDAETLNQIVPVKIIGNFKGGRYLVYSYNKSAKFRIHQVRGDNAVLSGIFFDSGNSGGIQHETRASK